MVITNSISYFGFNFIRKSTFWYLNHDSGLNTVLQGGLFEAPKG